MNIGIIDADLIDNGTRHPNLALMKISGFYKSNGHKVELITQYEDISKYNRVYISKVFSFTQVPDWIITHPKCILGGTGFFSDGGDPLPKEIEHHMPDYDLYKAYISMKMEQGATKNRFTDYMEYSIGFTTRGCFRKCEFCVNKKYDRAFKHSPVTEFLDEQRPAIYLWDDNFLAYSNWEEILDELEATGKPFQFRQGLDIRLLSERSARRLAKTKYHGDFIFAFDHIEDRDLIEKKLKLWRRYTTKTTKLYIFCAYESQDENDIIKVFKRIKILMKYGCLPYIMRYESYKESSLRNLYTQLARWCNQPQFFKKKSFRQFCIANQDYHRNKKTNCSAYQSMLDFERDFPEIAKMYFDLRYDEENQYKRGLGFGRKFPHKPDCQTCEVGQRTWINAINEVVDDEIVLKNYYAKDLDLQCLTYKDKLCFKKKPEQIAKWFCGVLLYTNTYTIVKLIAETENLERIEPSNIPQFSSIEHATNGVLKVLLESGKDGVTFAEMGYYLDGKKRNDIANRKYGENQSKLATLLDLAVINFPNNSALIYPSLLGQTYYNLSNEDKERLLARLTLRIPIIQKIMIDSISRKTSVDQYLKYLAPKTHVRRKPNVIALINLIKKHSTQQMDVIFNNILEK